MELVLGFSAKHPSILISQESLSETDLKMSLFCSRLYVTVIADKCANKTLSNLLLRFPFPFVPLVHINSSLDDDWEIFVPCNVVIRLSESSETVLVNKVKALQILWKKTTAARNKSQFNLSQ